MSLIRSLMNSAVLEATSFLSLFPSSLYSSTNLFRKSAPRAGWLSVMISCATVVVLLVDDTISRVAYSAATFVGEVMTARICSGEK